MLGDRCQGPVQLKSLLLASASGAAVHLSTARVVVRRASLHSPFDLQRSGSEGESPARGLVSRSSTVEVAVAC